MSDLIDRQKAIKTAMIMCERCTTGDIIDLRVMICESLAVLPTADTDMSEYSDRLWKMAYERGKNEGIVQCKYCKWSRCHINVDKQGETETYWRCLNWDGETDEEGFCHEWERRTDATNRC